MADNKVRPLSVILGNDVATPLSVKQEVPGNVLQKWNRRSKRRKLKREEPTSVNYFSLYRTATAADWALMFLGTVGAIANGAAMPLFSLIFGKLLNTVGAFSNVDSFLHEMNTVVLYFVYLAIGTFAASYAEVTFWMLTGTQQGNRMRQRYFQQLLRADVAFFDQHATTGELLQGLNQDCVAISDAVGEKVGNFIHHMTTFIVGFAIAFWRGWDMTLVMLACVPLLAGIGILFTLMFTKTQARGDAAYSRAAGLVQEALSSVRTVFAFTAEPRMQARYCQALAYPERVGIWSGIISGITVGSLNGLFMFIYALALWYGSTRILAGAYDGGKVVTVLFTALIGGMAAGQAAPNVKTFQNGRLAGARIFKVVNRPRVIDEDAPGEEPATVAGGLELRGVQFAYPSRPEVPVLQSLSVAVPAGQTVAFVGESGSGKSTIVQLLCRFYDPLAGQVLLDGVDIRGLQLRWYRQQMGLVSQEPTLFATSIALNIAHGRPGTSADDIEAAARAANAHAFIRKLPLGYDTPVGEGGIQLSGGQKQRIAIARAIVRNPKILLLDEATSALDTRSERAVQHALDNLMKARTTVVVAHRLSTIVNANCIAVLQGGDIVEKGTHTELIARPAGAYATLLKMQLTAQQQEWSAASGQQTNAASGGPDDADDNVVLSQQQEPSSSSFRSTRGASGDEESGKPGTGLPQPPWWQLWRRRASSPEPKADASFKRLLAYNRPEWRHALCGCLGSAMAGAIMPVFALAISSILAVFYVTDPNELRREVRKWCLVFVGMGVAGFLGCIIQQYCFGFMGQKLTRRLRQLLFSAMLRQEVAFFDKEENSSGALSSWLATDTASIRGAVGDQMGLLAQNLVTFLTGYIIAFSNGWQLTLVITAVLPLLVASAIVQSKFMVGFSAKGDKLFNTANQTATEAFTSIRTVAAFSLAGPLSALYSDMLKRPTKAGSRRAHANGLGFGFSQFIIFAVYALAFWYGAKLVAQGTLDLGELLKVIFAIILAAIGMGQAQLAFPDITKAKAATQRVFSVMDRQPAIDSSDPGGQQPTTMAGSLELQKLCFAYPQRLEVPVFTNLNLIIDPGTTVALVGPSGSGKSSIVSLIQRFYTPTGGQILLDGVDIQQLNIRWLRSHIGLVSQEPVLFSGTVAQNIAFGCETAPDQAAIEAAARTANAHDFICASPAGYSTQLGEAGGISLSGGQKQRVAIARAVLKDPSLLLLDEATSALDATSEGVVQSALEQIMAGRTTLVIAHRLSTIRNADVIAVVQDGHILEQGTHDELMSVPRGAYAGLVQHQHSG